jgi:ParB family chromosome partitioning protein
MPKRRKAEVPMVPLESIRVLNPRDRNQKVFESIVESIRRVGLKKPIVVTPRVGSDGESYYALVCGEGRLNAFRILGETSIPALVIDVSDEEAFIMSLVENIARRQYRPLEIMSSIRQLADKGYSSSEIAAKTALTPMYVIGILNLLKHGEERLLVSVEKGLVPLNTALDIMGAGNDDKALQAAMQEAYEAGTLRGSKLRLARRIVERRQILGGSVARRRRRNNVDVSSSSLVRAYEKEVERKKMILRKADLTQKRLMFVASALRQLLAGENFINLIRAEHLDVMPLYLAERVWPEGGVR